MCSPSVLNASSGPYADDESPSAPRPTQARNGISEMLVEDAAVVEVARAAEQRALDADAERTVAFVDPGDLRGDRGGPRNAVRGRWGGLLGRCSNRRRQLRLTHAKAWYLRNVYASFLRR